MIKIAICDDNIIDLESIKNNIDESLRQYMDNYQLSSFLSGTLLINAYNIEPFDIIFLDIDMPKINGFDIAKKIRSIFSSCFIIFITSHSELVYDSLDFQPFHFIQKNISHESLNQNLNRVIKKLMQHIKQNDTIILEDDMTRKQAVYIRDILYIESNNHYINYHVLSMKNFVKMRGNLKDKEEELSVYDFIRIHKKYLINLRHLSDISTSKDEVFMDNGKKLSVSRTYKKEVDEKHTIYLRTKS